MSTRLAVSNNGMKYYIVIATILFRLSLEIEGCSLTTDYIVNLIYDKENYLQDPCYIQWKATEDAKLAGPRKPTVESALIEFDRWRVQEAIDSQLNRQKMYSSSSLTLSALAIKKSTFPIALVLTIVVVIICCFLTCLLMRNEDDSTTDTATDIPQRDVVMSTESLNVLLQSTSGVANDPLIHEGNSIFNNVTTSSSQQHSRASVPPMAARQNSLPSYDEALKMASPPRSQ